MSCPVFPKLFLSLSLHKALKSILFFPNSLNRDQHKNWFYYTNQTTGFLRVSCGQERMLVLGKAHYASCASPGPRSFVTRIAV